MQTFKSNQKIYFLSLSLIILSGCWPLSDKKNLDTSSSENNVTSLDDNTLVVIDGKAVLTVVEYENLISSARAANQQVAMILDAVPNGEEFIFKGILRSKLMKAWGQRNGIDKSPEFLEEQKQAYDLVDFQIYMKYYEDAHPTHVSDQEVKDFYEEKKSLIPALVVSAGGVEVQYVRFDKKDQAQSFFEKVKNGSEKRFVDEADSAELTLQEDIINESSQYGESVKKFAETVTKTPHVSMIKISDNNYWVIQALRKTNAEYRSLETPEVKEGLRQMIMGTKREAELDKNMEDLKSTLNVLENKEYFEKKEKIKQGNRKNIVQDEDDFEEEDTNSKI